MHILLPYSDPIWHALTNLYALLCRVRSGRCGCLASCSGLRSCQ